MEELIPIVNKLQDAFTSLGMQSPIDSRGRRTERRKKLRARKLRRKVREEIRLWKERERGNWRE